MSFTSSSSKCILLEEERDPDNRQPLMFPKDEKHWADGIWVPRKGLLSRRYEIENCVHLSAQILSYSYSTFVHEISIVCGQTCAVGTRPCGNQHTDGRKKYGKGSRLLVTTGLVHDRYLFQSIMRWPGVRRSQQRCRSSSKLLTK